MATVQQQIKATLEASGIPFRQVECYGAQIVVTAASRDAAIKWGNLLAKFATVRRVAFESLDERRTPVAPCAGQSLMQAKYVKVFRTFAVVA